MASKPFVTFAMSFVAWAMEVLCFLLLWLLLDPVGSSPVGGEPYSWRRPVPGWRQSEESVTLENHGFHFEPAEFEAHFRDQGMLQSCLCRCGPIKVFSLSFSGQGDMWRCLSMHI